LSISESAQTESPTGAEAGSAPTPQVSVRAVRKTFGPVVAVDTVDLEVMDGEFSGSVFLGGVDATTTPPFRRDVNTVFQDYALFPHMTVGQNVGYGLRRSACAGVLPPLGAEALKR
jgi:putative spermidine/putrescine transport system ATP-binding protein